MIIPGRNWGISLSIVVLAVDVSIAAQPQTTTSAGPSSTPPQTSTAAAPPRTASSLEERVAKLESRTEPALALLNERIQLINERSQLSTEILKYASIIGGLLILFYTIRDWMLRSRESQRQRGIDEIVKEMMKLQLQFGQLQVGEAGASLTHQGAGLQKVNQVIETVNQTLAFRLQQEEKFARTIEEIERMKSEQHERKKQKLAHAIAINAQFANMSRMEFASLTDEQYRRGLRLQALVNESEDLLDEAGFLTAGSLLYDCGVISYYDNDVIEAKDYLDRAEAVRAPDDDTQIDPKDTKEYRRRISFLHYFRALIQKNWGDLSEARREIELSLTYDTREEEFLTPVTKAEILSYMAGYEKSCQRDLAELLERIRAVENDPSRGGLNENQQRLRNRMLVLSGNVHFIEGDMGKALARYKEAVQFRPGDYYALGSAAQCEPDANAAKEYGLRCLRAIEDSGDFRRKRERITRVGIAVTAANAARRSADDRAEQWTRDARDLLSGNLAVDGMSPKFFSPATKRQVSAQELLQELDAPQVASKP